jgi:hypothetical protein
VSRAARAYVADVERKDPRAAKAGPKKRAFTLHVNRQVAAQTDKRDQTTKDAAAYDAMIADRKKAPRKPPTMPANMPQLRSPGSRGLEQTKLTAPAMRWTGEGWVF